MVGDYGTMPVVPTTGALAPALTNGLYLSAATTATAPTYNAATVPEFSLDLDDYSEIPVIRFGTIFPTRKLAISVHNATAPGSPVVGYLFSTEHVSRLANKNGGPITQTYMGMVQSSLASTARTMLPEGEYTIGLQYVRPTALTPVTNPDAALVQGWMSPKFRINRAKRPNKRPMPPNGNGGSKEAPVDVKPAPGVEAPPMVAKN
ncbi:hypothetical protein BCR44DRAFT_1422719 [Catenaria anguillulae PL171]|uniref:Uncharacterized protein n=1 Tax=Catenaria anguillulae PL171 TaxID=765915 RepID=A0A1Y2I3E3_9FUNG|nr:hypothetical protein BCR44DRAFT_1422719 [Catenaria anguillulae PL171]